MIIDFDAQDLPVAAYDICIAGAGVAGIVLANRLAATGRKVLLLEAGGTDFSDRSQDCYKGQNIGHEYFDLDTARLRFLGGSSNHWAGYCRPLDPFNFIAKPHIPDSGWPISHAEVEAYLPDALEVLDIEPFPIAKPFIKQDSLFNFVDFHISGVRFKQKYQNELEASDNINVVLNANVVDIVLDPETGRVASFQVKGYSGKSAAAKAGTFVLAAGGIENPRMLLNANKQVGAGLGNQNDLVGRYFMEHIIVTLGYYAIDSNAYDFGNEPLTFVAPRAEFQLKSQTANCCLRFEKLRTKHDEGFGSSIKSGVKAAVCESDVLTDLARTIQWFGCPQPFDRAGYLRASAEQVPNPRSRVTLSDDVDSFGLRRVALDWQLSKIDKDTLRKSIFHIAEFFAMQNIGRVKVDPWLLNEELTFPPKAADELAGYHHMGTTRMGRGPDEGVVDTNCKVFGIDNLYVAGSSVFPTGGHANPTLTIVQLAARLADHIAAA